MSLTTRLAAVALIALMAIGSVVLWLGIPLGWLWVASQLTTSTSAQMGPYVLVAIGIPATMVLFGYLLKRLNEVYAHVTRSSPTVRFQPQWLKSMRSESVDTRPRTILDLVMVASVGTALLAFVIWFAFFAGSSLPGG